MRSVAILAVAGGAGCSGFVSGDSIGDSGSSTGTPTSSSSMSSGDVDTSASGTTDPTTPTTTQTTIATSDSTSTSTPTSTSTSTSTSTTQTGGTTDTSGDTSSSDSTGVEISCDNEIRDGEETDVDCGGLCKTCDFGQSCLVADDCTSGFCDASSSCGLQTPLVWLDALDDATLYNDDACTSSPPTAGQQVYCWANKGSEGGLFVDEDSQPLYLEDVDGLQFDNSALASDAPIFDGALGDVTLFFVQQEWASRNSFDFNLNHPQQGPDRYSSHMPWGNSNRHVVFDIGGTGDERIETAPNLIAVDETHLFTFVNSPDEDVRLILIDGTERASGEGPLSATAGTVSIGNNSRVNVFEVRIYSPSPTLAQRHIIEGQLACRWDLRDQLDVGHPYYSADGASDAGCPPEL